MNRPLTVAVALLVFWAFAGALHAADSGPYVVNLPIPEHNIRCDLSLWKGSFRITKVSYDKDANQVIFIVKGLRDFTFKDDGFQSIKFYDADGVDMLNKKNFKWTPLPKDLKRGESARVQMDVPDDDVLKSTKRCAAVATGFFHK